MNEDEGEARVNEVEDGARGLEPETADGQRLTKAEPEGLREPGWMMGHGGDNGGRWSPGLGGWWRRHGLLNPEVAGGLRSEILSNPTALSGRG